MKSGSNIFGKILICLLFVSCIDKKSEEHFEQFKLIYKIEADSVKKCIPFDDIYTITYRNYFIVSSTQADFMLHFYSLPTMKYVFSCVRKGHGPNETSTHFMFCNSSNKSLILKGFGYNTLTDASIISDSLCVNKNIALKTSDVLNQIHLVKDSLLYYNDIETGSLKKYNILTNNLSSYIKYHNESDYIESSFDICMGNFTTNAKIAIYAYQYQKVIDVYNAEDLSFRKRIKWDFDDQKSNLNSQNADKIVYYYTGAIATDKYFYLLNQESDCSIIEVYDSLFNPVCCFVLDKMIYKFSISEKFKKIIGFGDNEDYIYVFDYNL